MSNEKDIALSSEYEYGFHDEDTSVYKTKKGKNIKKPHHGRYQIQ